MDTSISILNSSVTTLERDNQNLFDKYTFESVITKLERPIGKGCPVYVMNASSGTIIHKTETDEQSKIYIPNLRKYNKYLIIATDLQDIYNSVVFDVTWDFNANLAYNYTLNYYDISKLDNIQSFFEYQEYEQKYDQSIVSSYSHPNVKDTSGLLWNTTGNAYRDNIKGIQGFRFLNSNIYLPKSVFYQKLPFTFEAYFNVQGTSTSNQNILYQVNSNNNYFSIHIDSNLNLIFRRQSISTGVLDITMSSTTNLKINGNYHVALSYDGFSFYLFLNGVLQTTLQDSFGLPYVNTPLYVGHSFNGIISHPLITNSCKYTTDFSVLFKAFSYNPVVYNNPSDAFANYVMLLIKTNNKTVQRMVDDKARNTRFDNNISENSTKEFFNVSSYNSTITSYSNLPLGTRDFCIEISAKVLSKIGNTPMLASNLATSAQWESNNWVITFDSVANPNKFGLTSYNTTHWKTTYPAILKEQFDLAVVREGTKLRFYINGFLDSEYTIAANLNFDNKATSFFSFGKDIYANIYDLKFTLGSHRYSADYIPALIDIVDKDLLALQYQYLSLPFKKNLNDTSSPLSVTSVNLVLTTKESINGTSSARFNGTASYLELSSWYTSKEKFTVEFFVMPESSTNIQTLFTLYNPDTTYINIGIKDNILGYYDGTSWVDTDYEFSLEDFNHVVIQREGSLLKVLANGSLATIIAISNTFESTLKVRIGASKDTTEFLKGYLNNLFIYKNYIKFEDSYEVPVEEIVENPDLDLEPVVTINDYTTSALDFENNLIDYIPKTTWNKVGTADVTSTNKIFGNNSFETKLLGDSLYTNSKVITGGSTPFTIEFYALLKGTSNSDGSKPLISKVYNGTYAGQGFTITSNNRILFQRQAGSGNPILTQEGIYNKPNNEIIKYTFTYDGSALRLFHNDKLDLVAGTSVGFYMGTDQPMTFMSLLLPSASHYNSTTYGLIDNINIFDGIATKVRNLDPYEKNLIVDLAFDGENNSTKIIDNAITLTDDEYFPSASLLLNGDSPTLDLSRKSQNLVTSVRQVALTERAPKFSKTAFAIDANNSTISCNIEEIGLKPFTLEMWVDPRQPAGDYARFFEIGAENWSGGALYLCNPQYNYPAKLSLGIYADSSVNSIRADDSFLKDQWNHVVLGRDSDGFIYTALNGKIQQVIDKSVGSIYNMTDTRFRVGTSAYFPNSPKLSAYIDSLRVVVGQSVYSSVTDFEVPEEPFGYNSSTNWTVSGNAKISTDQKFDGFSSLYVPNISSYIESSLLDINLLNDIYTFNFEFITNSTSGFNIVWRLNNTNLRCVIDDNTRKMYTDLSPDNGVRYTTNAVISGRNKVSLIFDPSLNTYDFYLNGILTRMTFNKSNLNGTTITIGRDNSYVSSTNSLNGYVKNFKIYKGVAVIPESHVGKIQLDFDNNLNDKYGNSTWTNNGVTFDQVNSVSGYAVSIDNNKFISTNTQNLNLSNLNSVIEFDVKPTNNITSYSNVMRRTDNTTEFMIRNNATGVYNSNIFLGLSGSQTFNINNYYNWKMIRVDNGNLALIKFNDILVDVKNNGFATFDISDFQIGQSSNSIVGYVDNFKVYKEDLISEYTKKYGEKLVVNYLNDDVIFKFSEYLTTPYQWYTVDFNDFVMPLDFIMEIDTYFSSDDTSLLTLIYKTNNTYSLNSHGNFGYCIDIGRGFWFGRGSNSSTSSAGVELFSIVNGIPNIRNNNYHKIKLIVNGDNHKVYIDDILYMNVNDSAYSNVRSSFAFSSANNAISNRNMRIRSITVTDLYNNELYYKDWKSRIENVIDKPVFHLPLEASSVNIGFTNVSVGSTGSPTYTTIDGKKCIKFESGKYLSIDSHNVFNVGTNTDYYIEFDFYPTLNSGTLLSSGPWSSGTVWLNIANDGKMTLNNWQNNVNTELWSTSSVILNTWNNIKLYRKNTTTYMVLNNSISSLEFNLPFDFVRDMGRLGTYENNVYPNTNVYSGYMSDFKMFVGTSELPETYDSKKVLDLDFKPTGKSYLFKDNNNKCIVHPVNITQRDYQNSQYCCTFKGLSQCLQFGQNQLFDFSYDDFIIDMKLTPTAVGGNYRYIMTSGCPTDKNGRCYLTINPYSNFCFGINSGGTHVQLSSTTVLSVNTTYNVTIQRIGKIVNLYIDGVLNATMTFGDIAFNFNYDGNTVISRTLLTESESFEGTLYSIKVLRNTSDMTLLEDKKGEESQVDERGLWIVDTATWSSNPTYATTSFMRINPELTTDPVWNIVHKNTIDFSVKTYKSATSGPVSVTNTSSRLLERSPLNKKFYIQASNGTWSATSITADLEFLDSNDNLVMVMRWNRDDAYRHGIWYGPSWTSLTKAPQNGSYPQTYGILDFKTDSVEFYNRSNSTTGLNQGFSYSPPNYSKISKIKVNKLEAIQDYTGGQGSTAMFNMYMVKDLALEKTVDPVINFIYPGILMVDVGSAKIIWNKGTPVTTTETAYTGVLTNTSTNAAYDFYTAPFTMDMVVSGSGNIIKQWQTNLRFHCQLTSVGELIFSFYTSSDGMLTATFALGSPVTTATQLTLTRDANGYIELYVNGVKHGNPVGPLTGLFYTVPNEQVVLGSDTLSIYNFNIRKGVSKYIEKLI